MSTEPENRLIDEPEFRVLLEAAQDIDVEDTWLDAQLDQILEKIGPPPPSGGSSSGTGGSTGSLAHGAFKLFAPILVGTGVYLALSPTTQPPKHAPSPASVNEAVPTQAPAVPGSYRDMATKQLNPTLAHNDTESRAEEPKPKESDVDQSLGRSEPVGRGLGRAEAPPETNDTTMPRVEVVERPQVPPPPMKPDAAVKTLLKALEDARNLAKGGDIDQALMRLAPLLETTYRLEVLGVQAELAYQHQRYEVAAQSIQALLSEKTLDSVAQRSLLRRLGDALAKQGLCGKALLTYQKALRLRPSPEEEASIRAAMVRCNE